MFKNLDKKLLRRFPLLWNTKFPYIIIAGMVFNFLAFLGGYNFSNFSREHIRRYSDTTNSVIIVFGILGSIILVIWLIFYFRNNGFKAYYPKSKNALFKEWILLFLPLLLFFLAFFSVEFGRQKKAQQIFSNLQKSEKLEVVFKAGFFLDNPIERQLDYSRFDPIDSLYEDSFVFTYRNTDYPYNSLIARYQQYEVDSITDVKFTSEVRNLFYNNDAVAVKKLMTDYLKIAKENNLKTNLTVDKWFAAVFRNDCYDEYSIIKTYASSDEDNYIENELFGEKSSLYVQHQILTEYYKNLVYQKEKDDIDFEIFLFLLYLAFGFSLLLFVFRISSLVQWFFSIVIVIILMIINVVLFACYESDNWLKYHLFIYAVLLELVICVFLAFLLRKNSRAGRIALNVFILSFGYVLVLISGMVEQLNYHFYNQKIVLFNFKSADSEKDNLLLEIASLNLLVIIIGMYLLSRYVRNRKALPEE